MYFSQIQIEMLGLNSRVILNPILNDEQAWREPSALPPAGDMHGAICTYVHSSSHSLWSPALCTPHTSMLKRTANTASAASLHRVPWLPACVCVLAQSWNHPRDTALPPPPPRCCPLRLFVVHPAALRVLAAQEPTQPPPERRKRRDTPLLLSSATLPLLEGGVRALVVLCQLHATQKMPCNCGDGACRGRWQLGTWRASEGAC